MMTQLGKKLNPFNRSGESSMSIQDRMAQQQFVKDLVGKASVALKQGISSGLINPSTKIAKAPVGQAKIGTDVKSPISTAAPTGGKAAPAAPAGGKAAAAPAAPAAPATPAGGKVAAPAQAAKTPAQIRQEKLKVASANAQSQMKPKPTTAPAATPAAQAKMTPQQAAALKGRLKAGSGATSAKSGFKNYVGGSGERMTGVDKSGAPIFKKIQRESKFSQLNYVLESIISLDEANSKYAFTISSYLQDYLKQYMGGMDISALKPMTDQVQKSWKLGGGGNALQKLASAAYSLYSTGGSPAVDTTQDKEKTDTTVGTVKAKGPSLVDIYSGSANKASAEPEAVAQSPVVSTGSTTPASTTVKPEEEPAAPTTTPTTTPVTAPAKSNAMEPSASPETTLPASPEKVKTVYMQVKDLVNKLDKKGKQRILATLEKEVGAEPSKPAASATTATGGAGAFGKMAGQLAAAPTPSSTGGTTTGVSGVGSGVVKHTAGKGTKVKQAKATRTKQAVPTKTKKASPLPVAESKQYKVWGAK